MEPASETAPFLNVVGWVVDVKEVYEPIKVKEQTRHFLSLHDHRKILGENATFPWNVPGLEAQLFLG